MISFLLNHELWVEHSLDPNLTVLNYLRTRLGQTGTKEGCASGDCGACTVVLGEANGEQIRYRSINACLSFVSALHGKQLITVEGLKEGGRLHPAQRALVEKHASQCGFCTPGFVMSLFALAKLATADTSHLDRHRIQQALAGNLCRCTGYRPIIDAAEAMLENSTPDQFDLTGQQTLQQLRALRRKPAPELSDGHKHAFHPRTLAQLDRLYRQYPDARLVAGGTDLALEVTQQHREIEHLIYLGDIPALKRVQVFDDRIELGAAVPLSDCRQVLADDYPALDALLERFGSPQIRNQGTLGGNIGNASPVGDTPPALIALNAKLQLRQGGNTRRMALESFFTDYRRTALRPGEIIQKVIVPRAEDPGEFRCYKISKRQDDDISSLLGCFNLRIAGREIKSARIAFGGMAAVPKRALGCESALIGRPWQRDTLLRASQLIDQDFSPISDFRASREYRLLVAKNLFLRYFSEIDSPEVETDVSRAASAGRLTQPDAGHG